MKQNWWSNYKIPFLWLIHIVSGKASTLTIMEGGPEQYCTFFPLFLDALFLLFHSFLLMLVLHLTVKETSFLWWSKDCSGLLTVVTLSVSKHGFCVLERCFGLKRCLLSAQHCKLLHGKGLSSIFYLYVRYIGYIPLRCPPPLLRILMYLKYLLHNLCSINNCFKGCDTTSTCCFLRLVPLCHVWKCFTPNRAAFMYVCIAVSPITLHHKQLIPGKSHKEVLNIWEDKCVHLTTGWQVLIL